MATASLREQCLARLIALLQAGSPGGVVTVARSREVSLNRALSPAIVVMPSGTAASRMATETDKHQLEFNVEIFVRGEPWDSLVDPIDVAAHRLIMTDATLATLVVDVRRVSESFDSIEADKTAGTLTVGYRATYLTQAIDISVAR